MPSNLSAVVWRICLSIVLGRGKILSITTNGSDKSRFKGLDDGKPPKYKTWTSS